MKKIKSLIALITVFAVLCTSYVLNSYAIEGTPISTYSDFLNIANDLNGNYYLTNDITVKESDPILTPMGDAVKQFNGVLDGRNYSIKGLKIAGTLFNSTKIGGIFAYNGGTVKNLKVENVALTCSDAKYSYAGVIAGVNLGNINNCLVSGNISNKKISIAQYTGGIAGQMLNGSVTSCVSYANIYAQNGEIYLGGITGYNERGKVSSSAVYSSVFADASDNDCNIYAGGITGYARDESEFADCLYNGGIIAEKCSNAYIGGVSGLNSGNINRFISLGTYLTSNVFSHVYVGAVAGDDFSATVKNAYFAENTLPVGFTGKNGTAVSSSDISNTVCYQNFDFHNLWSMTDGVPCLKVLLTPSVTENDVLSGIKIKTKPKKLSYFYGETPLDLTGIKVYALYGEKQILLNVNDFSFGGFNPSISGKQTITVIYKGFKDTFDITVSKKANSSSSTSSTFAGYINGDGQNSNIPNIVVDGADTTSNNTNGNGNTNSVNPDTAINSTTSGNATVTDGTTTSSANSSATTQTNSNAVLVLDTLSDYEVDYGYYNANLSGVSPIVIIVIAVVILGAIAVVAVVISRKYIAKRSENIDENTENHA